MGLRAAGVKCVLIPLLALASGLWPDRVPAQTCLGLPLEPGHHDAGAMIETESGHTLLAARYAGSSSALSWRAYAGGVNEDFPGSFPGDFDPAVGAGLAWVGASRATCPTLGLEYSDEDPDAFSVEPGDSDRDVTIASLGWGAGFSTVDHPDRPMRAIVYVIPQVRWVRVASRFGDVENVETDRQLAFESGVTVAGRRLWAGGGARVRYRDDNDYPLDAVLQVRGGVRW